jgi:hypothetical protein
MAEELTKKVEAGQRFQDSQLLGDAIRLYEEVIKAPVAVTGSEDISEEIVKAKEQATYKLAALYKEKTLIDELVALQKAILPLFINLPKSKVAKIVRTLFDLTLEIP